ncbi:NAD(P)-binding protein [Trematosphaeria pertusa]|uniref:NAD(P)-binding protein n=1 Tax=Trematosphaeria pertusa TaxID=390896 RepID=A0A6A6I0G2_9PLEO|nr:NAD(P)-binding protein [Trematosphaeria pertusa]KAF2243935.1 NAD(P)-binding protein [Trematosphaeria pertusa]
MASEKHILLIGAGELGTAFLPHLSELPDTHVIVGVRTPSKYSQLAGPNISLTSLDTTGPSDELAQNFAKYDVVISATGFGQAAGIVTKLAKEILEAGKLRKQAGQGKLWFFPWQWGVDYDITGDGQGLMPLFGEQKDVRDLLRAEAAGAYVKWTVMSTGIFMSFLFEQFWGIVDRQGDNITVRALRDWDHKVTVTDVQDIGKILSRVVAEDMEAENRVIYSAGDTVSYAQLADIVERVTGKAVVREEWTIQHLEKELAKEPDNLIKKYRLVFARDGVWWDKKLTVNHKLGVPVTDVETYAKGLFGA